MITLLLLRFTVVAFWLYLEIFFVPFALMGSNFGFSFESWTQKSNTLGCPFQVNPALAELYERNFVLLKFKQALRFLHAGRGFFIFLPPNSVAVSV